MKILAADVGGTYIKFAVMNENAEFLKRGKIETPKASHEKFLQTIAQLFQENSAEGIALSLPGIIDVGRGLCVTSGALEYNTGKFLVRELEEICRAKVTMENDANCAALAEAKIGSLADVTDGFVMVFGTAVGGAFIKNHEIHRGKNNLSGEISYIMKNFSEEVVEENFFGVTCGVPTLLKNYSTAKKIPQTTGENFFRAVDSGDEIALACLDKFTRQIALQIYNIQLLLDPEKIAVGGGVSAQTFFIESIQKNLEKVYGACLIKIPPVPVVPCKFRNDANLLGAFFRYTLSGKDL